VKTVVPPEVSAAHRRSRNKGKTFERDVANEFRAWLGAEWTVARNQTDRQRGQVRDSAGEFTFAFVGSGLKIFPFCVECKAHESFDYHQLWVGKGPFARFFEQAVAQATAAELKPLLIFKRNNGPILVAAWKADWDHHLPYFGGPAPAPRLEFHREGRLVVVTTLEFMVRCTPLFIDRSPPPRLRKRRPGVGQ